MLAGIRCAGEANVTIPTRIRRSIDVDGVRFDWCVTRRSGALCLVVERGRSRVRILVTPDHTLDDAEDPRPRPLAPRQVAEMIRWAQQHGWTQQPGLAELRRVDDWGRQHMTSADFPAGTIPVRLHSRLEAVVEPLWVDPGEDPALAAELAASGLCERPRVAEGSVDVRLADLTDAEALLLLRIWLAAQRRRLREAQRSPEEPEEILNYVAAPSGGLALWDDEGLCRIAPACCCSLDNRQDWRDAMAQRGADSETLWTGHPWSEVRYEAPFLVLQPPAGPRLSVHPRHLARLLAAAEATIEAFAKRLRPLLSDLPEAAVEAWVRRCAGR
jgi:hypothetical protein